MARKGKTTPHTRLVSNTQGQYLGGGYGPATPKKNSRGVGKVRGQPKVTTGKVQET